MEKQKNIISMFDDISKSYDLANGVLSFGIDSKWRKEACEKSLHRVGGEIDIIADIACGTGDMMLSWKNVGANRVKISEIVGVDPSANMLEIAQKKLPDMKFHKSEALKLPFENDSIDIISIAYGLRNVCDYSGAIREFYRVLKKGGVVTILEFTRCENPNILTKMASFYTKTILPVVGGIISKNYKAYKYLPDSIDGFLSSTELSRELEKSNFKDVYIKNYSANISTLVIASK